MQRPQKTECASGVFRYRPFWVCLAVFFCVNLFLFYNQATGGFRGAYTADVQAHIEWASEGGSVFDMPSQARSYPLYHILVNALSLFFNTYLAGSLPIAAANTLSAALLYWYICGYAAKSPIGARKTLSASTALAFSLLIVSMLIIPLKTLGGGAWHVYHGVYSPNPWHNPTYIIARPFAIITFFEFCALLCEGDGFSKRRLVAFAAACALCNFAKPSFSLVFLPAAGIMLAAEFFAGRRAHALAAAAAFIPTLALLAWQYREVYVLEAAETGGGGLALAPFSVWSAFSPCVPLSIVLAGAFGLVCAAGFSRRIKETPVCFRAALLIYLFGLLEAALLGENNYRSADGDLFWGYMYGLFFLFAASALTLLSARGKRPVFERCAWGVYALHALCGAGYLAWLLTGGLYQ